jgi:hypothetical protein
MDNAVSLDQAVTLLPKFWRAYIAKTRDLAV